MRKNAKAEKDRKVTEDAFALADRLLGKSNGKLVKRKRVEVLLGRAEGFVMPLRFTLEFDPKLL